MATPNFEVRRAIARIVIELRITVGVPVNRAVKIENSIVKFQATVVGVNDVPIDIETRGFVLYFKFDHRLQMKRGLDTKSRRPLQPYFVREEITAPFALYRPH